MCLWSKYIKNRKYVPNKKNGGIVPAINDKRVMVVPVGCGKCIECRKQKAREWQVRLLEDIRENKNGMFVTMTFSNESIIELTEVAGKIKGAETKREIIESGYVLDNEIARIAVERFRERWRKEFKKSIRHWFVTELGHGETEHIHLHGLVWTDEDIEKVKKHWKYGTVWKGDWVSEDTVSYLMKYVHKEDKEHEYYNSKVFTSAGIGAGYMKRTDWKNNKYKKGETKEYYKTRTGHKIKLPIYYRNKIYSEEEREKLWIEKLDKEVRWVMGQKIDISKNEDDYWKILAWEREKNKRLGYGNGEEDWDRKEYERQRRVMKNLKRMGIEEMDEDIWKTWGSVAHCREAREASALDDWGIVGEENEE